MSCGPREQFVPRILRRSTASFEVLVQSLHDNARGVALDEGSVPATTYWMVDCQEEIVGISHLRHFLNERLRHEGGHIGYGVRPSRRGQGVATRLLALTLDEAAQKGLPCVLLVCDKHNPASARIIQKNGGMLENEVVSLRGGHFVQRYWIEL